MFKWLLGDRAGLAQISRHFGQMIEDGRHIFDAAANTLLGGTEPAAVEADLFATDKRINLVEQKIRRELVVHMTVSARADFPVCLKLMSLVKDAERIGDYAKNIFALGKEARDFLADPQAAELVALKDRVSRMLAKMRNLYESQDEAQARAFVDEAEQILKQCDDHVRRLIHDGAASRQPVVAALMYRYVKRVVAHCTNIVSSILMPIDKLDYFDESPGERVPEGLP